MRHRLERSEIRTLLIVAFGLIIGVGSVWMAASTPVTPQSQRILNEMCPHWTEC